MSKIALTPNANGSGVFTLASPNSNTNRTITLPDESVTLGAGTPSIDDNGNATALTIDSSENILVGKSSQTIDTVGVELLGSLGKIHATRDGGASAGFNRKTSDGDIAVFYKDGTTVGAIGTGGGGINFNSQGSDFAIRRSGTDVLYVGATASYPGSDNTKDLGVSSFRWKDAYLSGGVYLGGTVAANKLDDYEEGTFTPTVVFGSGSSGITYSVRLGKYTKIGNTVQFYVQCSLSSKGSSTGNLSITGLPFTNNDTGSPHSILTGAFNNTNDVQLYLNTGSATINLENRNTGSQSPLTNSNVNNNSTIFISGVYRTTQ